ncbi:intradiol ring-cleavage dioxygenase [Pontibacter sp. E15-1]|uniref:dioxygenase family protein n=1 Tax=Pontibacter sp. E15-1 TaxID=2919918 RepID=UPI001F4FA44D|nr:intradiol ring-cleavage dioxygenase [Pontibacter sp. E15-1]MCJ8164185.1 intradiol ring-cleavage dioxygenase [Pontibacter sp. E15-1]
MHFTRRRFFVMIAALPLLGLVPARFFYKRKELLEPTPECDDHDTPTPSQTEGPFYTPRSPERSNLREKGMKGTALVLTGQVLDTRCQPVAGALLDWWHADAAGHYDNDGYKLRGHHYTDAEGRFRLETIVPGVYTGRTRHFHVKVKGPNTPLLTTQLYFPGEPANERDYIFKPALLMSMSEEADARKASYTFVLKA